MLREKVVLFSAAGSGHYFTYVLSSLLLMLGGTSATYALRYLSGRMPAPPSAETIARLTAATAAAPGLQSLTTAGPHVLVATRGGRRLINFAASYCRKTHAAMYVLFVRQVNVGLTGGGDGSRAPEVSQDEEAVKAFALAEEICRKAGVTMMPMYVVSQDVAYTILDFAATYGVEAVLMGVSRVGALLRALRGDVIAAVADNLPEDITLLIHA
jgi:nucleotide-binding universal stress UspA family protein